MTPNTYLTQNTLFSFYFYQNMVFYWDYDDRINLVHCKLYWVPACAALRLGSDARLN